jgi:uncharacterized protein YlbG (UPF0298 family)
MVSLNFNLPYISSIYYIDKVTRKLGHWVSDYGKYMLISCESEDIDDIIKIIKDKNYTFVLKIKCNDKKYNILIENFPEYKLHFNPDYIIFQK